MNEAYIYVNCHYCKRTLIGCVIARVWHTGRTLPIVKCERCGATRSLTSDHPTEARALHTEDHIASEAELDRQHWEARRAKALEDQKR